MAIRRVSKSSRFSRSRTPPPPKPKPKPVAKPKPVSRTTRFTPKPAPKPAPKPVSKPTPKPTTSSRISRGTVRFTRTPPPPPKPKPVVRTVVRTPPKPAPKPVSRVTRFTPRPPPPPPVVRLPPAKPKPKPTKTPAQVFAESRQTTTKRPRPSTAKPKPIVAKTEPNIFEPPVQVTTPSGGFGARPRPSTAKVTTDIGSPPVPPKETTRQKALRIRAEKEQERAGAGVPFIAGVPALIGSAGVVAKQNIPFQETELSKKQTAAQKAEGFKGVGEGFLGGRGAVEARAEAFDLSEKVLSEEEGGPPVTTIIPGGPPVETIIPGGPSVTVTDPITGVTTTTKPGDTIITDTPGDITQIDRPGAIQTIGQSKVESDFSDPLGSLGAGISQSALNEVIGIKNVAALATGGEQEDFFVTPSSIFFDSSFKAIQKFGGEIFDLGRQAAGKKKVEAGQSITTFGIAGDEIRIDQQERGPTSGEILQTGSDRFIRVASADPLFAVGDIAVQTALLAVAPVKAASVAIKGIGAAGKFAKVASKGVGAIKGRNLISASGKIVTKPKPKTPISTTFADEFQASAVIEKAQAPTKAQLAKFNKLTTREKSNLVRSQREEFELAIDTAQKKPKVKGLGIGEETAEFAQRRRDAADVARLPKERISTSQLSPDLQKSIKELETGGTDLFKVQGVTSKNFGVGIAKTSSKVESTREKALRIRAEKEAARQFDITNVSLGKGIIKFPGDDFAGGAVKGGKRPPGGTGGTPPPPIAGTGFSQDFLNTLSKTPKKSVFDEAGIAFGSSRSGFTGTTIELGKSLVRKTPRVIPKAQIDELAKKTGRTKQAAEKNIREAAEKGISFDELTTGAGRLVLKTELATAKVATLKQTKLLKQKQLAENLAKQKAITKQKELVATLKKQRAKATTKASKAKVEAQTQAVLRKLIVAEKAAKAAKVAQKSELDILLAKPRKLKGKGTDDIFDTVRTPKGKTTGILGGVLTGTAIGVGVGLGNLGLQDPKVVQKDPTRLIFDPGTKQTQFTKQPTITTNIFRQPTKTTTIREPRLATTFFQLPGQTTKTQQPSTTKTGQPFQQKITQPLITTVIPPSQGPPGFPPGSGFPFDGSRKDEAKETKSQRRFFRLFDVAKTPFGRIEVGLGAQVQSDKPIFEFEDVPLRSGKKRRNIGEDFFEEDFSNIFA